MIKEDQAPHKRQEAHVSGGNELDKGEKKPEMAISTATKDIMEEIKSSESSLSPPPQPHQLPAQTTLQPKSYPSENENIASHDEVIEVRIEQQHHPQVDPSQDEEINVRLTSNSTHMRQDDRLVPDELQSQLLPHGDDQLHIVALTQHGDEIKSNKSNKSNESNKSNKSNIGNIGIDHAGGESDVEA